MFEVKDLKNGVNVFQKKMCSFCMHKCKDSDCSI